MITLSNKIKKQKARKKIKSFGFFDCSFENTFFVSLCIEPAYLAAAV